MVTPENRDRWDKARTIAEQVFDDAPNRWQATRSIYHSDIPTDGPIPSDG